MSTKQRASAQRARRALPQPLVLLNTISEVPFDNEKHEAYGNRILILLTPMKGEEPEKDDEDIVNE